MQRLRTGHPGQPSIICQLIGSVAASRKSEDMQPGIGRRTRNESVAGRAKPKTPQKKKGKKTRRGSNTQTMATQISDAFPPFLFSCPLESLSGETGSTQGNGKNIRCTSSRFVLPSSDLATLSGICRSICGALRHVAACSKLAAPEGLRDCTDVLRESSPWAPANPDSHPDGHPDGHPDSYQTATRQPPRQPGSPSKQGQRASVQRGPWSCVTAGWRCFFLFFLQTILSSSFFSPFSCPSSFVLRRAYTEQ